MDVIKCEDVTKTYRRRKALDQVSFSIGENKLVGLVGRNGAGKTTLMKVLAGMLRESSGRVEVFSRRPFNDLTVSANSIFIDDEMNFPPTMTLVELLQEGRRFYQNWDHELAMKLFEYFNLPPKARHQDLSKGMQSTFNMIVGLCARCPLTIFDEPTTGMDSVVRQDFYRALLKDYLAHPRTILVSTHYLNEMEEILEEVVLLDKGQLVLQMPIDELNEYTIRLSGKKDVLERWIQGKEVLLTKETGHDDQSVILKNSFSAEERQEMKRSGVHVSSVSASDACIYATSPKGGVDHVFDRSEDK